MSRCLMQISWTGVHSTRRLTTFNMTTGRSTTLSTPPTSLINRISYLIIVRSRIVSNVAAMRSHTLLNRTSCSAYPPTKTNSTRTVARQTTIWTRTTWTVFTCSRSLCRSDSTSHPRSSTWARIRLDMLTRCLMTWWMRRMFQPLILRSESRELSIIK